VNRKKAALVQYDYFSFLRNISKNSYVTIMKFQYYTCDVFTDKPFGGNQLAVFPDAVNIPEDLLQTIAREFNFSETTFVYPASNPTNTKKVRIFTPQNELPFAGHPTIGTAIVLATTGEITIGGSALTPTFQTEIRIILEEGVGPVPVTIRSSDGKPSFAQFTTAKLPEFDPHVPPVEQLAAMLTLPRTELVDSQFPVQFVSVGFPFLFIAVKNRESLKKIRVNTQLMEETNVKEVFVFTEDAEQSGFHFRARMFAPLIGIPEDPATGSAGAAFAGYLAMKDPVISGTLKWNVEQGIEMGRSSFLYIEADKQEEKITAIRVGGHAVMMTEGSLEL
jgi:trans-2,3-dihydro-3-hydroxyanthranilate isomerase